MDEDHILPEKRPLPTTDGAAPESPERGTSMRGLPMKVLMVNDYFAPIEASGGEVSLAALADLLHQRGVEVEVLARAPASSEPPRDSVPFPVHFVPYRECRNPLDAIWETNYFSPMRMAMRLGQLLSSEAYDILHAHNCLSAIAVLMAKRSGVPLPPSVLTVRSYNHVCPLGHGLNVRNDGHIRCNLFRTAQCVWRAGLPSARRVVGLLPFALSSLALHHLAREAVACFDRYICISSFVRQAMEVNLGIRANQVATIPEFLDLRHLALPREERAPDEGPRTILYVGRLVREKGVGTLLEAFRRVVQTGSDARLVVVGDGGTRRELEAWSTAHGLGERVVFLGWVGHTGVAHYYQRADIVVVPSAWPEPLGIVVLEALYFGKAVIATRRGGILDVIEDGVNGLLVPHADPSALADAMLLLLNDPELRERLGKAGPGTIAERFAPDELTRRTLDVYQELAARPMGAKNAAQGPVVH